MELDPGKFFEYSNVLFTWLSARAQWREPEPPAWLCSPLRDE